LQAIGFFLLMIGGFAISEMLVGFLYLLCAGAAFRLYMKLKK
jgi:hypothetical protein